MSPTAPATASQCSTKAANSSPIGSNSAGRAACGSTKNGLIYVARFPIGREDQSGVQDGHPRRQREGRPGAVLHPAAARVDAKTPPPEGISVDSHGTIYASAVQMKDVKKYTK